MMKDSSQEIPYTVIRSRRKSMCIQVKANGQVLVRCPLCVSDRSIREFVDTHRDWIGKQCERVKRRRHNQPVYTQQQRNDYREQARAVLAEKTSYWAEKMGVAYGKITIREQKTRWGSCSSKGNLNYNWKLILLPGELLEYVVVHELAHRKEMNHSSRFWEVVAKEMPDYRELRRKLKEHEDKIDS